MLRIHGRATSSNVQAVMWLVGELGLPNERLDVGGAFGGNQTAEFLAMNPMGRVPVIEDEDVTLFESQAILRYLAARHGSEVLWPSDPVVRAPVDQWMEWAKVNLYPSLTYKVFWQLVRTSAAERDHDLLAEGAAELDQLMTIADAQIARHGWLAGAEMTLADIAFGTHLFRYFTVPFDRADLPALRAYYDRLCARPAYAEHAMVSFEALRVPGA
ncbi:glutathione S-transferase family protein [Pacificoceanicola onchidii]|uniref:glutathione S-transferase family protein n=1 Tax=Pacificoceanicola onchidii TaxID=2562685 RepID=UPI0010A39115|nr:glutathione S-transferase family protein [Pacificoceanicola onchidii]